MRPTYSLPKSADRHSEYRWNANAHTTSCRWSCTVPRRSSHPAFYDNSPPGSPHARFSSNALCSRPPTRHAEGATQVVVALKATTCTCCPFAHGIEMPAIDFLVFRIFCSCCGVGRDFFGMYDVHVSQRAREARKWATVHCPFSREGGGRYGWEIYHSVLLCSGRSFSLRIKSGSLSKCTREISCTDFSYHDLERVALCFSVSVKGKLHVSFSSNSDTPIQTEQGGRWGDRLF